MDIFFRRSWSPIARVLTPSMITAPSGSTILNRMARSEDFPAPVLPTIPTWGVTGVTHTSKLALHPQKPGDETLVDANIFGGVSSIKVLHLCVYVCV